MPEAVEAVRIFIFKRGRDTESVDSRLPFLAGKAGSRAEGMPTRAMAISSTISQDKKSLRNESHCA
jgi:hypothetical protein